MAENEQATHERQFKLMRIYTKDASFESPNSPDIFRGDWQPKHELQLNTKVRKLTDESYEVVLSITASAKIEEKTAFIAEVHQAGVFGVKGFPEAELGPLFGAYCPNLLFPYAREVVSDLVTKGSFPQLLLQPVNFEAMFAQHQQQLAEQGAARPETAPH